MRTYFTKQYEKKRERDWVIGIDRNKDRKERERERERQRQRERLSYRDR